MEDKSSGLDLNNSDKMNEDPLFKGTSFNPYVYFYRRYSKFPHRHWVKNIDRKGLLDNLSVKYDIQKNKVLGTTIHSSHSDDGESSYGSYALDDHLLLDFPSGEEGLENDVHLYYSDEVPNTKVAELLQEVKTFYLPVNKENVNVRLLMLNKDDELEFVPIVLKRSYTNIELNYNDDLFQLNEMLVDRLNRINDKGLVIFYGKAGTGKTTYIRYLAGEIDKQKLFVPASLSKKIGNPEFLALLRDYKNSILIIEDADWLLKKKNTDDDQVLANILTLSDGLLSDFFHIQIICTFNNDIRTIEPTLLRKGRLIAKYYFKELEIEKATRLCMYLGYKFVPETEMVLADIFFAEEKEYQTPYNSKRNLGFR
ncbi:MAG: AAA family ATPase [Bacteroidia bacterium]|nr:AAA family ATPase [Bacteroidia bacterium]